MKLAVLLTLAISAFGQDFTQRGTLEFRGWLFPQTAQNDSSHAIGEALFRYEISQRLLPGLKLFGTTETRIDSHHQVDRRFFVNISDRTLQRPAFSIRRASLLYDRGPISLELGKQVIRWGKADILNPTDRFAPRDFLNVTDNDIFGVLAARAVWEAGSNSFEVVAQPRFTPSRLPLANQRWAVVPSQLRDLPVTELAPQYPGGTQYGARWNHLGHGYEASLSFYEGHNHLPLFDGQINPQPFGLEVFRYFPHLRLYGADLAMPTRWFTVKGEAAWFTSKERQADEYVIWVVQAERQFGEASFVAGYAGEAVTRARNPLDFAPDRGLAKTFLGRFSYTIDPRRSVAADWAIRQNGDGVWTRWEYTQILGTNWRVIAGATLIRGNQDDFLGQYRRNSHATLMFRYTF